MSERQEIIEVQSHEIGVMRDPYMVLAEAKKAAVALMEVVKQKAKPVIMNGEQYLEFEDWQILGQFYGLSAKVVSTSFIELGGVKGYEAKAELIRNSDGMALSSADAMCLNDEDKWSTRTKYEWVNKIKTKVGEVPVPLFQLRSMAQTRACAKALRNKLAWVAVLAGFKPTIAEEMTGDEESPSSQSGKPAVNMPKEKETTAYVDIISLSQSKVGDVINLCGYAVSVKHRLVGEKKSDISDYTIGDLPKDPTATIVISAWGVPIEIGEGQSIKFNQVTVGEFKGKKTFLAKEVLNG
jgi:hypothetical protein